MAVFESKLQPKEILDDTLLLKVTFETTQLVDGHTKYVIRVQRGPWEDRSWHICKRYSDFLQLHHGLIQPTKLSIRLPPKKIIGNMERNFIAERQAALQVYVNTILMNPIVASSLTLRRFLDPSNYPLTIDEHATQHVAMALRSELDYELIRPLPDIGWRIRKRHFSVKARLHPKADMVLQYVEYGPDKRLVEQEVGAVLRALTLLNHPHVLKLEMAQCGEMGAFVIRRFEHGGTLRDLLCCSKPCTSFIKKYGNPQQTKSYSVCEIADYGRQILETLLFLKEKNIPYGHLHTGNILIIDGQVKLLDIENGILGLSSYYRPFFLQHKKIATLEAIDVYTFGHVLYEMVVGQPLFESVCDNLPQSCHPSIRTVLDRILSPSALRSGMPTLTELLHHDLFISKTTSLRINFRLSPMTLRDAVQRTADGTIARLRADQKATREEKRMAKVRKLLADTGGIRGEVPVRAQEDKVKSPGRSDSPVSSSTVTSAGTATPPQSAAATSKPNATENGPRTALLDSICAFDKSQLKQRPLNNGTVHD